MKKITLFLVMFALFTGVFGAYNTAQATSAYPSGCLPGYLYNPLTGAPCNTTPVDGCLPGYKFNPLTGEPCTVSTASLKVLSPNGGETWQRGTNKSIDWKNTTSASTRYDISLSSDIPSSAVPYAIARNVSGTFYHDALTFWWSVGKMKDGSYTPPDGRYKMRVCQTGTDICDLSDSYFKITSGTTTGPVISGVSGPTTLKTDNKGTWTVKASDPNNGVLNYSVIWGDETPTSIGTNAAGMSAVAIQQTATFTHIYNTAGVYSPKFTVQNASGQTAETSLSVSVSGASTSSLTVLSPSGGETWVEGSTYKIKWSKNYDSGVYYNLYLENEKAGLIYIATVYDMSSRSLSWTVPSILEYMNGGDSQTDVAPTSGYRIGFYSSDRKKYYSSEFNIVPKQSSSTITVLSPNGGEVWKKGATQTIKWKDTGPVPLCIPDLFCAMPTYYISLSIYNYSSTDGNPYEVATYPVALGVGNSFSYAWSVGKSADGTNWFGSSLYKIQVCRTGTSTCDSSDSYFRIIAPYTTLSSSGGGVLGAESFVFSQKLERGSQGNEVLELQKYLNSAGYYNGIIDGKFGLQTQTAVAQFQSANALKVDGIVGAEVRVLLNR